jgi:hypothetical protein
MALPPPRELAVLRSFSRTFFLPNRDRLEIHPRQKLIGLEG